MPRLVLFKTCNKFLISSAMLPIFPISRATSIPSFMVIFLLSSFFAISRPTPGSISFFLFFPSSSLAIVVLVVVSTATIMMVDVVVRLSIIIIIVIVGMMMSLILIASTAPAAFHLQRLVVRFPIRTSSASLRVRRVRHVVLRPSFLPKLSKILPQTVHALTKIHVYSSIVD